MPAFVSRDLAEWLARKGGRLIAGATPPALDRSVEGASVLRHFFDHDLAEIAEGTIVLTTFDAILAAAPATLGSVIETLAPRQGGLIVAGLPAPDVTTDRSPYEIAERLAFPLFAVPAATDLVRLGEEIESAAEEIYKGLIERIRAVNIALNRALEHDPSPAHAAATLAAQLHLACIIEDDGRAPFAVAPDPTGDLTEEDVRTAISSLAARRALRPATPDGAGEDIPVQRQLPGGLARAIVPLREGRVTLGYLSVLGPDASIDPRVTEMLWHVGKQVIPLLRQTRAAQREIRRSPGADLLELLSGAAPDAEMHRLAQERHIDLALPHAIVLASALGMASDPASRWAMARVEELHRMGHGVWAAVAPDALAALVPHALIDLSDPDLATLIGGVAEGIAFGIGGMAIGVDGVRRSYYEAGHALDIARRTSGHHLLRYDRMGVWQLLVALPETETLAAFWRMTLAPLLENDTVNNEFLETLEHFFAANGNLTEAARRLNLHRNTLMYRLGRIESLLGGSLDDPDRRLALHLALKIRQMQRPPE
jgi:hypothetical protein